MMISIQKFNFHLFFSQSKLLMTFYKITKMIGPSWNVSTLVPCLEYVQEAKLLLKMEKMLMKFQRLILSNGLGKIVK